MKRLSASMLWSVSIQVAAAIANPALTLAQTAAGPSGTIVETQAAMTSGGETRAVTSGVPRLRIAPGDLLEVKVFDVPELAQSVRVDDVGEASFTLIGKMTLAGLTPDEARTLIARKLKEGNYIREPQVSVLIREYSTQGVSVLGEVRRPGVYPVLGQQTLIDLIAAAGGVTVFAGPDLTVKRYASDETLTVRLSRDASHTLASDVQLHPGDKIIVPRAGLVYVIGDVGRPGGFVMENDGTLTLLQAVAMAGGINTTASAKHSRLIRKTAGGYAEVPVALKKVMEGAQPDIALEAEDILYVPNSATKSLFTRTLPSIASAASGAAIYHTIP